MTKLVENIDLSKEQTKNLTETVQTLVTGLNSHGSHNKINPASHLTGARKKTNRTKLSKHRTDYLDKESGCVWPSSPATNSIQLVTTTQDQTSLLFFITCKHV